ncbi:MAG: hypothetical protein EU536_00305 [Promethearchaeota archaeon]|nr:MAG: hypothetical protein EU536_00305 [Candidatus Lokiarchaeota archaeon]
MKFYDLGINSSLGNGIDRPEIMIELALRLGFVGVAFADFENVSPKEIKILKKQYQERCQIFTRATIIPKSVNDLKEKVKSLRNNVDIIAVRSKSEDKNVYINAILDKRVDLISLGEDREFNALEYSHFKMARENAKVVELSIRSLLEEGKQKSRLMRLMNKSCLQLLRAKTPFILSSGGQSRWDLRAPGELIALAGLVKIPEKRALRALSEYPEQLIKKVLMIRDPNYIMAGVHIVKPEEG